MRIKTTITTLLIFIALMIMPTFAFSQDILVVRGWDPKKKQEIVGEAQALINAKNRETDPSPFPVRGKVEIYIEIMKLAKAINGAPALNFGLEIEGHNLRATLKNYVPTKIEEGVTFKVKRDGLISTRVQTLTQEEGEPRLCVPLGDVVKAFGGRLEVNQATGIFSIKVENCSDCLLEYVPPDAIKNLDRTTIQVDGVRRYQTFSGFGATLTIFENDGVYKRHDHNQPERVYATQEQRRDIARLLYSQLGLSRSRIVLEGFEPRNDNNDPFSFNPAGFDWRVVDAEANFVALAQPQGLQTWWASSEIVSERDAWRRRAGNPCAFNPAMVDEEVEWLLAAALHFRDRGLELKYMAIANEPDLCQSGHDATVAKIEIAEFVSIVKRLGKRLQDNGLHTKIVVSDGWLPQNSLRYMQAILNDSDAREYVGALAFHSYDGFDNPHTLLDASARSSLPHQAVEVRERIRDLATQYHLPVWMTEVCYCTPRDYSDFTLIRARLNHVHDELTITNVSAFDAMNLFFIDRPHIRDELVNIYFRRDGTLDRYEISTYGYLLSHYSGFILPGSVRLQTNSNNPGVRATTFERPDGGMVIVALNNNDVPQQTNFNFNGLRRLPTRLLALTSREEALQQRTAELVIQNAQTTTILPPFSVTTFYVGN